MKESLLARLKEVESAIGQTMANLNMLLGGKSEIVNMIQAIDNVAMAVTDGISPSDPVQSGITDVDPHITT